MTTIGTQIRDLKILSVIGEGGMGVVYLAEHVQLGKKFAVKCLTPELARNPKLQDRFRKEARAQARLLHPNIVQVTDYFEEKGNSYLLMEYVEGRSLEEIIASEGRLSENICVPYVKDILNGLNFAHSQGVIHRDIKPSNILIDALSRARIMDFGIAIQAGEQRLTKTGTDVGTAWYMSPEQVIRPKEIDHRSDVYSVGVVLYEMLTGQVPFDGETDYTVKDSHVRETPTPIGLINPRISMELAGIVMKALEKDPDDRFNGCGEFLEYIEAYEREKFSATLSGATVLQRNTAMEELTMDGSVREEPIAAPNLSDAVQPLLSPEQKADAPPPDPAFTDHVTGMAFALVPGGRFLMGDVFGEGDRNEQPVREMELSAFYMGKTPVTQGQWKRVMGTNPSRFSKGEQYPVEMVSWEDAQAFIQKLTAMNERKIHFRLPTEAEWEFAARSGGKNEKYAGGNAIEPLAWYRENSADSTHPVGEKAPNGLGLCDMSGNIREWCEDWFAPYPTTDHDHDSDTPAGTERVLRGGAWDSPSEKCRSTSRYGNWPKYRDDNWGFRIVRDMAPPPPLEGNLRIVSAPKGAAVWLAGLDTGQKTDALMDVPAGKHQVTVKLDGWENKQQDVEVTPFDVSTIDVRMEKKQEEGMAAVPENIERIAAPHKSRRGKILACVIMLFCVAAFYAGFVQFSHNDNKKEASVALEKEVHSQESPRQTETEGAKENAVAPEKELQREESPQRTETEGAKEIASAASSTPATVPAPEKEPAQGCVWGNCEEGFGDYIVPGVYRYTGAFEGSVPHGSGTMIFADGGKYTGRFYNGKKQGAGTYTLPNGYSYDGEWQADSPHGKGTAVFPGGEKYTGDFRHGKRDGKGTVAYADGTEYSGDFRDGQTHGQGTLTLPKVGKYEGAWRNGAPFGRGTLFCLDGRRFTGEFRDVLARHKEPPKKIQEEKAVVAKPEHERKRPDCRAVITQSRDYVYCANGTLKDKKSGLEWCGGPDKDTTFQEAEAWVKNLESFEGGAWRMPLLEDLKSINKPGSGPYEAFSYLNISGWKIWYMSESEPGTSAGGEWYFNFSYGVTGWGDSSHSSNARALAVRTAGVRE